MADVPPPAPTAAPPDGRGAPPVELDAGPLVRAVLAGAVAVGVVGAGLLVGHRTRHRRSGP